MQKSRQEESKEAEAKEEEKKEENHDPMNSWFILQDDPSLHSDLNSENFASQVHSTVHSGWYDQSRNSALSFSFGGVLTVDIAAQPNLVPLEPHLEGRENQKDSLQVQS